MKNKPDDRWQCEVHANGLVKVETKTKVIAEIPSRDIKIGTLVAAAPDLLAALEALVSDEDSFAEFDHNLYRDRMTKARAAIARAKGQGGAMFAL